MWDPQRLTTLRASMACYRDSFTLYLSKHQIILRRIWACLLLAPCSFLRTQKIDKSCASETLVDFHKPMRRYIPEDITHQTPDLHFLEPVCYLISYGNIMYSHQSISQHPFFNVLIPLHQLGRLCIIESGLQNDLRLKKTPWPTLKY
jgi:hypothetical protein